MSMAANKAPVNANDAPFFYPKGRDPQFHDTPTNAELLEMVLALTAELSVLRDRLDTHERTAAEGEALGVEPVDNYQASHDVADARSDQRKRLLSKVLRPLKVSAAKAAEKVSGPANNIDSNATEEV